MMRPNRALPSRTHEAPVIVALCYGPAPDPEIPKTILRFAQIEIRSTMFRLTRRFRRS